MEQLTQVLAPAFAALLVFAVFQWRKLARTEAALRQAETERDDGAESLEKARKEGRAKGDELASLKRKLNETQGKLKKHKEALHNQKTKKPSGPAEAPASAASVVELSDQELVRRHNVAVAALEEKLAAKEKTIAELKAKEAARQAERDALAARLTGDHADQADTASDGASDLDRLKEELHALQTRLKEQDKAHAKKLKEADRKRSAAQRRANGHQALYNVIKGQLELAEAKLALYRRKYEGARTPEEVAALKAELSGQGAAASAEKNGTPDEAAAETEPASAPASKVASEPTSDEAQPPSAEESSPKDEGANAASPSPTTDAERTSVSEAPAPVSGA